MNNAVNWFEIPAVDFGRAVKFYGEVYNCQMQHQKMNGNDMGFFPYQTPGVGGCIVRGEGYTPSDSGTMVYLNGGDDLAAPLARIEKAGGTVVMPKTKVNDEVGYIAIFMDTEGNRVALHSPQ